MILQSPGDVAFYIMSLPVYWYGIIMAFAVLTGLIAAEKFSKRFGIPPMFWADSAPIFIVVGLIGARLYYCLLNFPYYATSVLEIFNIREGGLSIHGMLIFGIVFLYLFAKMKKIEFFKLADCLACSVPLAQAIGRFGNFFNSEAFGIPTGGGWGLFIPLENRPAEYVDYSLFHPTFLYESICDLCIFVVLFFLSKKDLKSGSIFFIYLILYSVVRIFIEQIRLDSAMNIFGIPVAQIVSVVIILVSVIGLYSKKCN